MIIRFLCLTLSLLSLNLFADNLIKNSEVNDKLSDEFRRAGSGKTCAMSVATEDLTWNKCVKLLITSYYTTKTGLKKVSCGVIIGGEKGKAGFPVKPETTYKFSIELKGTAPAAGIRAFQWNGACEYYKDRKNLKTSVGHLKLQKDWTVYTGTFKTEKGAKRAALFIQLWDQSKKGKIATQEGDYLLIDKITVEEQVKKSFNTMGGPKQAVVVKKKAVNSTKTSSSPVIDGKLNEAAWNNASLVKSFVDYKTGKPVQADTEVKILSDNDNLYLAVKCLEPEMSKLKANVSENGSKQIWKDDIIEIFFSPVTPDRVLSQFVVSAAGGRWMGFGDKYGEWDAKVSKGGDSWTIEVKIPFKTLGWKTAPKSGDTLKFNVCRERTPVKELSCWSPVRGNFHDQNNFGILVVDSFASSLKQEISDLKSGLSEIGASEGKKKAVSELNKISSQASGQVTADAFSDMHAKLQGIKAQLKFLKTGNRKFTVAMVSPTSNFAVPFTPDEAFDPQEKFNLRAAVNEFKAMPLAITNMTDKTAAYRVIVCNNTLKDGIEIRGLEDFPKDKVIMREAVRVKDSEAEKHGLLFDPLPLINQAYTVTVPAKQSSLVWVTFDCSDVKPGTYKGMVRVIPLSEPAKYVLKGGWKYVGPMQDVPVSLEVMPIKLSQTPSHPLWLMRDAATESFFKSMIEHDNRVFQLSPWSFTFKIEKDGSIKNYELPKIEKIIRQHLSWAKKYNVKISFLVGFSAYGVFKKVHAKQFKYGSPEWEKAWMNWLKGVAKVMQKCGVDPRECVIETWDEPHLKDVDAVLLTSKLAKQANTGMQMQVTFGATQHKISFLKKLIDYFDIWCVWGSFFDDKDYRYFFISVQKNPAKKLWFYYCSTNLREPLYRYYRRHAWTGLNYKTDIIGLFVLINGPGGYYGRNSFKASGTDGAVVYRSFDQCIPSVRYECLRIGMTDIQYMAKLKELSNKAAKSGTSSALVAEARKLLTDGVYKVAVSMAHDTKAADEVRNKAVELILKLQKAVK